MPIKIDTRKKTRKQKEKNRRRKKRNQSRQKAIKGQEPLFKRLQRSLNQMTGYGSGRGEGPNGGARLRIQSGGDGAVGSETRSRSRHLKFFEASCAPKQSN